MFETIRPGLFKLEIPLPGNPLKAVNSYVFKTPDRNLIVDTGMNRQECLDAMMTGLKELDIDLSITDLFITHMHADHSGLISHLATETSRVYCSQIDADIINSTDGWEDMLIYASRSGFPDDEDAIRQHPGFKYGVRKLIEFTIVKDGDLISIGDYNFRCVSTPGHTQGHLCLYDPDKKLLLSGDHILGKITPNISVFADDQNPLQEYLDSLSKIYSMEVDHVLPAHRFLFDNCRDRIDQLRLHHQNRANAILSVLEKGPQNAFEIASQLKWDLSYKEWDQFPITQKWFATGEVISHLNYLKALGRVKQDPSSDTIKFSLT
ncbi:MAG: MBL fold metallo-hydrolase [Syntrophomonadales bacterium]|jgi:glyoxylase-like metal-dependent hydrolase (beta-lactamase superfamily II)